MSRTKALLGSLLAVMAVLAMSGLGASSAMAVFPAELVEEPCTGGKFINACWAPVKEGELLELRGEEEFLLLEEGVLGGDTNVSLLAKFGAEDVHIVCESTDLEENLLLQASPLAENYLIDVKLLFLECKLEGALGKKCLVPVEKSTEALDGSPGTEERDVVFKPVTGTTFIVIPFSNNGTETCPATIKGEKKITGEQLCLWDSTATEALTDVAEHVLNCEEAGSSLKLGENAATFEAHYLVELVNHEWWDISDET